MAQRTAALSPEPDTPDKQSSARLRAARLALVQWLGHLAFSADVVQLARSPDQAESAIFPSFLSARLLCPSKEKEPQLFENSIPGHTARRLSAQQWLPGQRWRIHHFPFASRPAAQQQQLLLHWQRSTAANVGQPALWPRSAAAAAVWGTPTYQCSHGVYRSFCNCSSAAACA